MFWCQPPGEHVQDTWQNYIKERQDQSENIAVTKKWPGLKQTISQDKVYKCSKFTTLSWIFFENLLLQENYAKIVQIFGNFFEKSYIFAQIFA